MTNYFDQIIAQEKELELTVHAIGIKRYYNRGEEVVKALDEIDLQIKKGEFVSIMGPSGSGKTTLFNCIGALDKPTEGSLFLDEIDIAELDTDELAWLRCRKIGYIFQSYNIIKVMTTVNNVMLPMIFGGVSSEDAQDRAVDILDRVGLSDRLQHRAFELSGGQQQRVAIARAFANNPTIILADEPTANLDLDTGNEIINILKKLNDEDDVTIITATHDFKLLKISDRVTWLEDGKIKKIETKDEIKIDEGQLLWE